jgi:magnesium chelatase subunit H
MPKLTSAADGTPVKVVIVTLDNHLSGAVERAERMLAREMPGISIKLHATASGQTTRTGRRSLQG